MRQDMTPAPCRDAVFDVAISTNVLNHGRRAVQNRILSDQEYFSRRHDDRTAAQSISFGAAHEVVS